MTYGYFKNLPRRSAFCKVLRDKAFTIAKNPKYDEWQRGLTSMVYTFFDKKSVDVNDAVGTIKIGILSKQQLAEESNKSIIRKFEDEKYTYLLKTKLGVLMLWICK